MVIDFTQLKKELLVAIRGDLSQGQLNKKLKFKSNQIYRWESGQAAISWPDFCKLCRAAKRPIDEAARSGLVLLEKPEDSRSLVERMMGSGNQQVLAQKLDVSRSVVSRWLSGRADPTLEDVLRMGFTAGVSITTFLLTLVKLESLPSIQEEVELEQRERELHFKYPWVGGVILILRTPKYREIGKHREGFIAERLGISLDEEQTAIRELVKARAIRMGKDGLYHPRLVSISLVANRDGNIRLRRYWTQRCLAKLDEPRGPEPKPILWPYLIFNTDKKNYEMIFSKVQKLYEDIREMSGEAPLGDEVYLFNMQLLELGSIS